MATLSISPETVCYIIVKAREFDAAVEPADPDPSSNPADDEEIDIFEDNAGNPTYEEVSSALASLNEDQTLDLIVLAWIGRGTFGEENWTEARDQAREISLADRPRYLLGMPLLGDYLEQGLNELGHSCEDYEAGRL